MGKPKAIGKTRCILGVFGHPDDETASAGGTLARYVAEGAEVYVITSTKGELGSLGEGDHAVTRDELPLAREREQREALEMMGVHPPFYLGYRDQETEKADFETVVGQVKAIMDEVEPDVVITFGPKGATGHGDHITMHRAAVDAFHQYGTQVDRSLKLLYVAIPKDVAERFELELDGPEVEPNVAIDISEQYDLKLEALRLFKTQLDIQEMVRIMDEQRWDVESYYQAYPPVPDGTVVEDLFD